MAVPVEPVPVEPAAGGVPDFERLFAPVPSESKGPEINPYAAPRAAVQGATTSEEQEFARVRFSATFRTAWLIYWANFGRVMGATFMILSMVLAMNSVTSVVVQGAAQGLAPRGAGSQALASIIILFALLALVFAWMYVGLGYLKYLLDIAAGEKADLANLFNLKSLLIPGPLLMGMLGLAVIAGSMALVVPGVVIMILMLLAPLALVDRMEGPIAAIRLSARIMSRNFLPGFLIFIAAGMIGNVLLLITCGLGLLVTLPFQSLLLAVIYLRATRRRTAID